MIPIRSLLARIHWDPAFGRGEFTVGYYDRVKHEIVHVPLASIQFDPADHFRFTAIEADGTVHEVPFHRIREVYRDGERIWCRPVPHG